MARYTEIDSLIEDLQYDIELDARTLDDLDFVDSKERELVQLDKVIKQNVISILKQTPTADVVEVVRCEECDARDGNRCRLLVERDPMTDHRIWSGFFCAYGERRDDG